jgi:hypothetical protein
MGAGHFFAQTMNHVLIILLLTAFSANAAEQTTTYTEQGGAVIVINNTTGAFVSERSIAPVASDQCKRAGS